MRIGRLLAMVALAGLVGIGECSVLGGWKSRRASNRGQVRGGPACLEHVEGESVFDRERTLQLGGPFIAKRHPYLECDHTLERAGYPNLLGPQARPTVSPKYCGDYVGGGAAYLGREPRRRNEGTWGWDYVGGAWVPGRLFLDWSHGRRYQGGVGSYRTDPDVEVPNIFANKLSGLHRKTEESGEE